LLGYLGATAFADIILRRYMDPVIDWPALRWIGKATVVLGGIIILPQLLGWSTRVAWLIACIGIISFGIYLIAILGDEDLDILSEFAPTAARPLIARGTSKLRSVFQFKTLKL